MKPLLDLKGKSKASRQGVLGDLEGLSVLAASPEKGELLEATMGSNHALMTVIMILHSTSATGGAIDNKIEQAMDLVKSHLLFAVREEVEVLKQQIKELLEKNEKLQRENSVLRQNQSQGMQPLLPYGQSEVAPPSRQHVGGPAGAPDQGGFPNLPGAAAPRADGYSQPKQVGEQQFTGLQAVPVPAQQQQQTLPQQQASQYGHLQQSQPPPPQQHSLQQPPQTSTQHSQPPAQT